MFWRPQDDTPRRFFFLFSHWISPREPHCACIRRSHCTAPDSLPRHSLKIDYVPVLGGAGHCAGVDFWTADDFTRADYSASGSSCSWLIEWFIGLLEDRNGSLCVWGNGRVTSGRACANYRFILFIYLSIYLKTVMHPVEIYNTIFFSFGREKNVAGRKIS